MTDSLFSTFLSLIINGETLGRLSFATLCLQILLFFYDRRAQSLQKKHENLKIKL